MKRTFVSALAILLIGGAAFGETRLVPNQEIAAIGRMEEPLPLKTLVRASLIASGVPADLISVYSRRLLELARQAAAVTTGRGIADGEALLQWMHREYLTRYVESQTLMDVLLETGEFNCVSSGVFYLILARFIGLEVQGVVTADHAFCRLPGLGEGIDVETTNLYGFNPGSRREILDLIEGQTGFAYTPPGNYGYRRNIGEKELVSLIYQNRIFILQQRKDWKPTLGLALDRWTLAGTKFARDDFTMALNNIAADAAAGGNSREVLAVLSAAAAFGEDLGIEEIAEVVIGNEFARLWNSDQLDAARDLVNDTEVTSLVAPSFLEKKRREIKIGILENLLRQGSFSEAVNALESALRDGTITFDRWSELSLYLWSSEAKRRSAGERWAEGWKFLKEAPKTLGDIPEWEGLLQTYEHNLAVDYHNRFVKAFRSQRWDEAWSIVTEGLSLWPDNANLLEDLNILKSRE